MGWQEERMVPIWTGNTVYEESAMFIGGADGGIRPAPLIYRADKVLGVSAADRKTVYREGEDYILEDGMLVRLPDSKIPVWNYEEFYLEEPAAFTISSRTEQGKFIRFDTADAYAARQVLVTYAHQDRWCGVVPAYQGEILRRTADFLRNRQPVKIVYYGDSITAGCDASSMWNIEPFAPQLSELVTMELKTRWGYEEIEEVNTAVGGTDSAWGLTEIEERVCAHRPDLVVLGFGMNDGGGVNPRRYEANVREMIRKVRKAMPEAEFLLIATMLPNPDGTGWTCFQPMYQWNLKKIAAQTPGVAVAPMTDVSEYILSQKDFEHVTGNGINHPNDFLVRVYAQVLAASLVAG
nr:SGNH/GDSL hydrolase family protein [uncultured Acetatifactor sp.]